MSAYRERAPTPTETRQPIPLILRVPRRVYAIGQVALVGGAVAALARWPLCAAWLFAGGFTLLVAWYIYTWSLDSWDDAARRRSRDDAARRRSRP